MHCPLPKEDDPMIELSSVNSVRSKMPELLLQYQPHPQGGGHSAMYSALTNENWEPPERFDSEICEVR